MKLALEKYRQIYNSWYNLMCMVKYPRLTKLLVRYSIFLILFMVIWYMLSLFSLDVIASTFITLVLTDMIMSYSNPENWD